MARILRSWGRNPAKAANNAFLAASGIDGGRWYGGAGPGVTPFLDRTSDKVQRWEDVVQGGPNAWTGGRPEVYDPDKDPEIIKQRQAEQARLRQRRAGRSLLMTSLDSGQGGGLY